MLTPGFNRWGQTLLHFGTSRGFSERCWVDQLRDRAVFDVRSWERPGVGHGACCCEAGHERKNGIALLRSIAPALSIL